jgi:hypothetical protein
LFASGAMHANDAQKRDLVFGTRDVERESLSMLRPRRLPKPRANIEA